MRWRFVMTIKGGLGGPAGGGTRASAPAVEWGDEGNVKPVEPDEPKELGELEELEMIPDEPVAKRAAPAAARARRPAPPPARSGTAVKVAAVFVVIILLAVGLGASFMLQSHPAASKPKPPKPPSDTLSDADAYISEVLPSDKGYTTSTYVEIRAAPAVANLKGWKLTTYANDSYIFPDTPVTADPSYIIVNFTPGRKAGGELALDPAGELGLYTPDGKLADYVRWAGGDPSHRPPRGGWAASEPGPYLNADESLSRLDFARCNHTAWNASPPSPGAPNILEVELSGIRQVLWLRSGRNFESDYGPGASPLSIPPGRPVTRAVLLEAASHLSFSLGQLRRLGDPYTARNSSNGAPAIEVWVTNGSTYRTITESSGRLSVDLGANRHINSFLCARAIAGLIELAKWGPADERTLFLREGLAMSAGLQTAATEISPGQPLVDSLWLEMRTAGLYNPYDDGRNLTLPFIYPWTYDDDHQVNAWLFFDYNDKTFVSSGLGSSLGQALLFAQKDPLTALESQTGHNLTTLYWRWLDWRTAPGFRYASLVLQMTRELASRSLDGTASLQPWTAWIGRLTINFSGSAEFNLSTGSSSAGPLRYSLLSARTGASLLSSLVGPGQARAFLATDLRPQDELVLVAGGGELSGGMDYRAAVLPGAPGGMSPPDGGFTNNNRTELSWSPVEGISSYEVQISWDTTFLAPAADANVAAPTQYQPEFDLADGTHYWRVRGWTPLGNPTDWSAPANFTVDTVPPFAFPIVGDPKFRAGPDDPMNITTATPISFQLNWSALATPEAVHYRFSDGEPWVNYTGDFFLSGPDGPRTMQYYADDAAGNIQPVQTLGFLLDNSPPTITITIGNPKYSANDDTDVQNISSATPFDGSAIDNLSGVGSTTYKIDGTPPMVYLGEFNLSGKLDGPHFITIISTDHLGNAGQTTSKVYLDTTPPKFSVHNLTNSTLQHGVHEVWIDGTDASGLRTAQFLVGSVQVPGSDGPNFTWDWDTSQSSDGDHPVEIKVYDHVDNMAYVFLTVRTDNTPPLTSVDIGTPKYRPAPSGDWRVSSKSRFQLNSTDATSMVASTWYMIDGAYHVGTSFFLLSLPDGGHNITFGSIDNSGNNETPQNISVFLDNTPPVPSIQTPLQNAIVNGSVTVIANESTGANDVKDCVFSYSLDLVTWTTIWDDYNSTSAWNCTWNTLINVTNNNTYHLQAEMSDFLDNKWQSSISVLVKN